MLDLPPSCGSTIPAMPTRPLLLLVLGLYFSSALHAAETPPFPAVQVPAKQLFAGEKLTYALSYLGMRVGTAEAEIAEKTEFAGRPAYRIEVRVRSHPVIDLVYKVRDEHTAWIDAEKFTPLRYEKKIREGRKRVSEIQVFDYEAGKVRQLSESGEVLKETPLAEGVQDQLSCGYYFRTLEVNPESSVFIPVYAEGKIWKLEVILEKASLMKIDGVGIFQALEALPNIEFEGIFVKKGKIRGWLSLDERRIPLKMETSVPVLGKVKAELERYEAGKA